VAVSSGIGGSVLAGERAGAMIYIHFPSLGYGLTVGGLVIWLLFC